MSTVPGLRVAGRAPATAGPLTALLLAAWGALIVVLYFTAPRHFAIAFLLGTLFPLAVVFSGNPRLFFLVGLVLAAPLGLSINFDRHIHPGGAPSYSIDLADFLRRPGGI